MTRISYGRVHDAKENRAAIGRVFASNPHTIFVEEH